MSEPVEPPTTLEPIEWRRLSPLMLLIHPVREAIRFIPVLLAVLVAGRHNGSGHLWGLLGLGIVIVASLVRWATTRFRITPDQVQLSTGLLRKHTVATPADRVRTVDVTAHALHRLLGLARVTIGTGTYDRRKEGLVLDGLTRREATALRAELLHRSPVADEVAAPDVASGAATEVVQPQAPSRPQPQAPSRPQPQAPSRPQPQAPSRPMPQAEPEQELLRFDPSWVRYAPFTLSGLVTGLAIIGFGWNVLQQSQVNAGQIGAVRSASAHFADTPVWLLVVQIVISGVIAVSVLSVIGYLLAFFGFRLTRHPGGTLHITRGLLTTRATSIEQVRLRGVELSAPLPLRAVRGARLGAVTTGLRVGRGSDRGGTVLVPPAPRPVAVAVAQLVLDEDGSERAMTAPLHPHGAAARRRRLNRACLPWLLLAVVAIALAAWAGLPTWVPLIALAFAIVSFPIGLDRYRVLGHRVVGGYLAVASGSLAARRVALESDGIIGWNVRRSLFQRRVGVTTLTATTAAGRQGYRLIDVDQHEAIRVIAEISPGLLDQWLAPDGTTSPSESAPSEPR